MKNSIQRTVDFLYENGALAFVPRSGYFFLGERHVQSVAEHTQRCAAIGYALAKLQGNADPYKTMAMCLFHDLSEARVSDLNHLHQRYATRHEEKAVHDMLNGLPFAEELHNLIHEYEQRESLESKLAKDADQLELILTIQELSERGNTKGQAWIPDVITRLHTQAAQEVAAEAIKSPSDRWWKESMG